MNRRDLLKLFPGAVAISIPAVKTGELPTDGISYRGFDIRWRGWFELPSSDILVGQWVAYSDGKDRAAFYAAYPGDERRFYPGQMFDVALRSWQYPVTLRTPEENKDEYRLKSLQRLKKLIDDYLGLQ